MPLLPINNDLDFEVKGTSPYLWDAYVGHTIVASGRTRSRRSLRWAVKWRMILWRAITR